MTVLKKTVAINQIIDPYVRKLWSILIQEGFDASYSTALNLMLLGHIINVSEKKLSGITKDELLSFLEDEKYFPDLKLDEYTSEINELFYKKHKKLES
jgi:hypothetical protein